jgi:hypothetical protein
MATKKDLKVRVRLKILPILLNDQGSLTSRPGRDGSQRRTVEDMPEVVIDSDELESRLADAALILENGYEIDSTNKPARVITEDATLITHNSARINATIFSHAQAHPAGFVIGTSPTLAASVVATGSPVNNAAGVAVYYAWSSLTPNTKYYFRAFATHASLARAQYGQIKSFVTDPAPAQ